MEPHNKLLLSSKHRSQAQASSYFHLLLAILVPRTTNQTTLNMSDSADTAAFFAKKNKKKNFKKFNGFNANRIDVSQVSSSIM